MESYQNATKSDVRTSLPGMIVSILLLIGTMTPNASARVFDMPSVAGTYIGDYCAEKFARSELWAFSFSLVSCTDRFWSIARRIHDDSAECVAIDPTGQLIAVAESSGVETVWLRNLRSDKWVVSADQFGDVSVSIDRRVHYQRLEQVDVSVKPPLRYGLTWRITAQGAEALKRGDAVDVSIRSAVDPNSQANWRVNLGGSREALDAAYQCAYDLADMPEAQLADRDSILEAQARLYNLNYDVGKLDGALGAKTEKAIRKLQKNAGLPQDGILTRGLLDILRQVRAPKPWGAIAYGSEIGWSTASAYSSRYDAENAAIKALPNGPGNFAVGAFYGDACAAIYWFQSQYERGYFSYMAHSTEEAVQGASNGCNRHAQSRGGSCELKTTVCAQADGD